MRYFAMIDGRQQGPFELSQLIEAGVGPDTYVWCKEMDDWQKADEVADICRAMRNHIFDLHHRKAGSRNEDDRSQTIAQQEIQRQESFERELEKVPPRFRRYFRNAGQLPGPQLDTTPDLRYPPLSMLAVSILLTLFCFPLTGLVAIYYSLMSSRTWQETTRSETKNGSKLYTEEEKTELKKRSYDYSRQAKMWAGITFFLGFILYAFLLRTL